VKTEYTTMPRVRYNERHSDTDNRRNTTQPLRVVTCMSTHTAVHTQFVRPGDVARGGGVATKHGGQRDGDGVCVRHQHRRRKPGLAQHHAHKHGHTPGRRGVTTLLKGVHGGHRATRGQPALFAWSQRTGVHGRVENRRGVWRVSAGCYDQRQV